MKKKSITTVETTNNRLKQVKDRVSRKEEKVNKFNISNGKNEHYRNV